RLLAAGTPSQIQSQLAGGTQLLLRLVGRDEEACAFLQSLPAVATARPAEGCIEVLYTGGEGSEHELLTALVMRGFQVRSFVPAGGNLEQIYMRATMGVEGNGRAG
ncbi:MAG TPA: hypothetical protein VM283_00575, partial [Armatimonadota bacterium]|nr:hypothetical protein [Armatimonadota bacterium]